MSGIKLHGNYNQRQHAEPSDKKVLQCGSCGSQMVQHLAIQDGWKGGMAPAGGLYWVCSRDVCRGAAAQQGVVIPR